MDFILHGRGTPRHNRGGSAGRGAQDRQQPDPMRVPSRQDTAIRPAEVPALDLGKLVDNDNKLSRPPDPYAQYPTLHSPGTASTVSWGTPINSPFALHYPTGRAKMGAYGKPASGRVKEEPKQKTAWDDPPVPDNLPSPGEKYKAQYRQYQQERQQQVQGNVPLHGGGDAQPAPKHSPKAPANGDTKLDLADQESSEATLDQVEAMQLTFTRQPYSHRQQQRKMDAEDLREDRRKQMIVEQVMVDMLSRAVISDPEQDRREAAPDHPPPSPFGFGPGNYTSNRQHRRDLHNTKVKTTTSETEELLSRRLRFGARFLTRNGRDALRELHGFYFAVDHSLTVYEFKQFGKRAQALPIIQRGIYYHHIGRRKGRKITIKDLAIGQNLSFDPKVQPSIPDSIRQKPSVVLRVTDLDHNAKDNLMEDMHLSAQADHAFTNQEIQDLKVFREVQGALQERLRKRGVRSVTSLGHHFRKIDKSGDGALSKAELKDALKGNKMDVSPQQFESVWRILDQNEDGVLDYGEFMRTFIGEMSEYRKALVRKAYDKLDPNRTGSIKLSDMRKFYNARKHPKVLSGEASEEEMLNSFLDSFSHC
ncbi:CAPS2 [Branchiostoma lanceolatum]|uniref:CAPS2 protein n=1 Tax=Branchiostoma lanceolatum TaxID=7740 RepID=A0A8J9ZBY6_BRALA|nr:CAPS2 [Branchiostoma lanceolatum]